ncbi:hypothetical protein GCM10028864_40450 [Microlunatus parietis]
MRSSGLYSWIEATRVPPSMASFPFGSMDSIGNWPATASSPPVSPAPGAAGPVVVVLQAVMIMVKNAAVATAAGLRDLMASLLVESGLRGG